MKARKYIPLFMLGLVILALMLSSCSRATTPAETPTTLPPTNPPVSGEEIRADAVVDSVEVRILESFPVQVSIQVNGSLPDSCTEVATTNIEQQGNSFLVLVTTSRPAGKECAPVVRPFSETYSLDVLGLPAGDYQVLVNGVETSFNLAVDNTPQTEPTPEGSGTIVGRVWHDLCAVSGGEGGTPAVPSAGCIDTGSGFIADGIFETGERGIPEVRVQLASGDCPGADPVVRITDLIGAFKFEDLPAGTYCLSVDAADEATNAPLLLPGGWTLPSVTGSLATRTIELGVNAIAHDQDFGWDFELLPEPEGSAACTNLAAFVTDVSFPDGSAVTAGEGFRKTWRLRNTGTCTWTPEYALVFDGGDQLGGPDLENLPVAVLPNETVDLSVPLTAPEADGAYEGFWRLQNPLGIPFGIGVDGDRSFWVRIQVGAAAGLPDLGTPTWEDDFSTGANWPLFEDDHTVFTVDDGALQMTAKNADWWNGWMLSRQLVDNYTLQASFKTGECSGYDHYGFVFRAPDSQAGYLFTVSCHGYYTLWRWDGEVMNTLKEWTRSQAINTGSDQENILRLKVEGDTFTLYANGTELARITDETLEGRKFGLTVGSAATENLTVEVDSIAYWTLEN